MSVLREEMLLTAGRKDLFYKLCILFSVVGVTVWRLPELFYQPRFYAEEGTCFFSYAFNHTWLENLLNPQFGYYTLYNFFATSFAVLFPVEVAPLVTTYLAFILQLAVSCTALWADIPELDSYFKRFLVALSVPLLPYLVIWLNTLGSQYMLCVITFFLLLENPVSRRRLAITVRGVVLALAGLTGVVSCFMAPSFLYKAIRTKSKPFAIYTAILILCSLIQVVVFLQARFSNDSELTGRFIHHDSATLLQILVKFIEFQFFIPFFGRTVRDVPLFEQFERGLRSALPFTADFDRLLTPAFIGGIVIIAAAIIAYRTKGSINTHVTLFSFVAVTVLSTIFSINMSGGPRYTFAPSIMLLTIFLSSRPENRAYSVMRTLAALLVFSLILANGIESRFASFGYDFDAWPKWRDEVRMWKYDSNYPLKIWPPPWEVKLQGNYGGK